MNKERLKYVLHEAEAWSLDDDDTWRRETDALLAAGAPARRLLVARETASRTPPPGIQLVEAWRYLLGETA